MTVECETCNQSVYLARGYGNILQVECECESRGVKVARVLPEGWIND